jgi:hypothetical protein
MTTTATATQPISTATTTTTQPTGTATATAPAASATATVTGAAFSDVPVGSTFYTPVMCLTARNIIGGYADGTFRPFNGLTRGQLAKTVAGAAGATGSAGGQMFADVLPGSTSYTAIQNLASQGIISGYACGAPGESCDGANRPYFRPASAVTRGQIAKIVTGAAGLIYTPPGQTFSDVPPTSTFWVYVEWAAAHSILGGYACGGPSESCDGTARPYFRPNSSATRGQAAKIVTNGFFPDCATP